MSYGPFFEVDFYYRCMFTYASKFWVANQSFTYNSICNTANDQVMKATKFVLSFAKEINWPMRDMDNWWSSVKSFVMDSFDKKNV